MRSACTSIPLFIVRAGYKKPEGLAPDPARVKENPMRFSVISGCAALLLILGCGQEPSSKPKSSSPSSETSHQQEKASTAHPEATSGGQSSAGPEVQLDALTLTAPKEWVRKPAPSSFVAAEFALPHAAGDEQDGRLTVSTAGGSLQANIDRWKTQFSSTTVPPKQAQTKIAGLEVTLVDIQGDFNDQRGPLSPAVKRSGYRMIAAIVPVKGELYFVKAVGPEKTMAAHEKEIRSFLDSLKPKG
jgi:hypothetical protein